MKIDPLLTNLNRTQNSASIAIETIVATDSTQSLKNCASCSENIIDFDFIMCITCEEKLHFQCQNVTSDQYKSMSIDELEQFKCTQCNLLLNDLSISGNRNRCWKHGSIYWFLMLPRYFSESSSEKLEKSPKSDPQCGIPNDAQQDHTGKKLHTAQQLTNIGDLINNSSPIVHFKNTHSDNNSIKQPKQSRPKKQKILEAR
ncbi:Hypothetical predicted protein [Mytilus galloprovincialis]|uniref:Zinc finger PHD-type domain-containing protein n=1 Tax=Mytilus galloprovincialis TaxID=29158 RepID=A0A8B6EK95_MYTGA|nr:Hypothetical predicted protein [Mytilus galloprovincialis]